MANTCELCVDCKDSICPGKACWRIGERPRCKIEEKCLVTGCEAIGGFIGNL